MSKHSLSNSNNSPELRVSNTKIENNFIVNDPSNFDILQNPHSVAVPINTVKSDTRLTQEILANSTLTEPFDPANYFSNTPTKSSLSFSGSYSSILERIKRLEHKALEVKVSEDQAKKKKKLELLEKCFQYQKQKIENEDLVAKEKVVLANFEQKFPKAVYLNLLQIQ